MTDQFRYPQSRFAQFMSILHGYRIINRETKKEIMKSGVFNERTGLLEAQLLKAGTHEKYYIEKK